MAIGDNIKTARKSKGFTQVALAKAAQISRSYLGDLEGNRYNPSLDTLQSIADALHVDVSMLLDSSNRLPDKVAAFGHEDLPPEAQKELESFKEYLINKYKQK